MTVSQCAQWLLSHDRFLILTHARPDGDTLGCATALCHALRAQGKTAFLLPNEEVASLFDSYLEGVWAAGNYRHDTVVAVDIATGKLLPENAQHLLDGGIHLTIDHHESQEFFAAETCLNGARAACGEIIYEIVSQWGSISPQVALPLYLAISTDTGCFVYSNTTAHTHRVAAELLDCGIDFYPVNKRHFRTKSFTRLHLDRLLMEGLEQYDGGAIAIVSLSLATMTATGASQTDIDDVSAFVGQIEGVTTGITLRELSPDVWKISLRTEPELLNASHVCALLGGGGHAAASGATICGTQRQATDGILAAIRTIQGQTTP